MTNHMVHDLRSCLALLEQHGQIAHIRQPVSLEYELGNVLAKLERQHGPAAYFHNTGKEIPVVGGVLASLDRIALILDCATSEIPIVMGQALRHAIPPEIVQQPAWSSSSLSLFDLPVPRHAPEDAGSFITGGITIARDPDSGRQNYAYTRLQVKSAEHTTILINAWRDTRLFLEKRDLSQPFPVAVAIGVDPAIMIAAAVRSEDDEIGLAGAIRKAPVQLAHCKTVDLMAPAWAEILIEGHVHANCEEPEGPMAEYLGQYGGGKGSEPIFRVSAISARPNPVFQTILPASFEHVNLGNSLPREPVFLETVQRLSPNIRAVHLPPYGRGYLALVSLAKRHRGEPKNVGLAALSSHVNLKMCVILDPDVDLYSSDDVLWAMMTRVDWSRDVFVVREAQGHEGDPAGTGDGLQTKIAVDATLDKGRRRYHPRVRYPDIDLSRYLDV
jgi:2,5-furandicarboxylate decarboxylase 1